MSDDDVVNFSIPREYAKARAIRFVVSQLDEWDALRSTEPLSDDRSEVDEDPDVQAEPSESTSVDERDADGEGGEPGDNGISTAPPDSGGESPDEGASRAPDQLEVTSSGSDELEVATERADAESGASQGERRSIAYHFAPAQHSRGN